MDSKKLFNIILILPIVGCVLTIEYDSSLKYIVDYTKNNLPTYQVTVVIESVKKLDSFGSKIVKAMIDEFSSIVIDESVPHEIPAVRPFGNLWDQTIDQSKLKFVIVQIHNREDVLKELELALSFVMDYSENVRGKCIVFLINGRGQSLEPFLRFAWSHDFLDLTVIEWIYATPKMTLQSKDQPTYEVLIHLFNPFQDKYTKDKLSNDTDILPYKVRDLQGYILNVEAHIYKENIHRKRLEDTDFNLMIHLMESLNVAMNYTPVEHESEYDEILFGASYTHNVSHEQPTDLHLNTWGFLHANSSLTDSSDQMNYLRQELRFLVYTSIFDEIRLSLLQEKTIEFRFSFHFVTTCGVLFAMALTFFLSSRIMRFDERSWSVVKIIRVLMGGTLESRRQMKLGEKILLVTLYFVSIVMTTLTSDNLLQMSMSGREVLRCTTLDDLANPKIILFTNRFTREVLSAYSKVHPEMQKIVNRSIVVQSEDEAFNIFNPRAPSNSIYGFVNGNAPKFPQVIKFGQNLYLTDLVDNIMTPIKLMPVRKNFPLKERFAKFFLKLSESGLMMRNRKLLEQRQYRVSHAVGNAQQMYPHYGPENDEDVEVSLNQKLVIIILSGYALACIVLIWEIFFKSRCPVRIPESNSKRKRFVRCLVQEAKTKIEEESIREFDLIQFLNARSQLISVISQDGSKNSSRLPVTSDNWEENAERGKMVIQDETRVLEPDYAHIIAHLKRKRRLSNFCHGHDNRSTASICNVSEDAHPCSS
ncbi:hypothetical protein QAD02_010925 [Eretmocerus hayati]|uniref:Uncharacterized protein n=1 Tax=Eretmocerus hayati TaxID=131215 RepID=A0ACC2NXW2_9HYME|nr:hypothetical protein QAD02_010925 [Eretmocerus hayati]